MSQIENINGIILRKRVFMEQDLIVTVLANDGLKHELIVKGAGTGKSKRRAHLETMNQIQGTLYHSRTNIYLQNVQCIASFVHLKGKLELLIHVQLILEIIDKTVMENDPHPEIHTLLQSTLELLNKKDVHSFTIEIALIKLAHHLGFLPDFKECSICNHAIEDNSAHWNSSRGTLECKDCSEIENPFPLKYRKALEFFRRADEREWRQIHLKEVEASNLKAMLPNLFTIHIDRPLKTLSLII